MSVFAKLVIVGAVVFAAAACSGVPEDSDTSSDDNEVIGQTSQASITPRAAEIVTGDSANIYKLTWRNELVWHRDLRRDGGLPASWHANSGNTISGALYAARTVVSGAQGQLYAIDTTGNLKWYGHTGEANGAWLWSSNSGNTIGTAWGSFERITASPDGTIYAVDSSGNLRWYQDLCRNGTTTGGCWHPSSGQVIGWGWGGNAQLVADEGGIIYLIDNGGTLRWYKNNGPSAGFSWAAGTGNTVGNGWSIFTRVFSGRSGILYGIDASGNLKWYRDLNRNGLWGWAGNSGTTIATGWAPPPGSPPTACFAQDAWSIGVEWTTPPGTTDTLGFRLRNTTSAAKTVDVEIVARGLDGRQERRPLLTATVAGQGAQTFSFPKSYLPIWSNGGQSAASLSARVQGSSEPPFVSRDLAYELDAAFGAITVYGRSGKPFSSITPEAYYGRDPGQSVSAQTNDLLQLMASSLASPVAGRIEANGQFQTWFNPTLNGQAGRGPTILLDGKWAQVVSTVLETLETPPVVNPSWQLCLEHRVFFRDEGRTIGGQPEYYRSSSQGTFPARYLWVTILRDSAGTLVRTPVYNGALDQAGCIALPTLTAGKYTAWTFERVQKDTTVAKTYDYLRSINQQKWCYSVDAGVLRCPDEYPRGAGVSFTVGANGQIPAGLAITLSDIVTNTANVAATYGQALFSPDNGFLPGETYQAFANERDPGTDNLGRRLDAGYSALGGKRSDSFGETRVFPAQTVYLGWSYGSANVLVNDDGELIGDALTPGIANAEYKYVVGHEIGHQIQDRLLGRYAYAYDYGTTNGKPDGAPIPGIGQLCRCTGLDPGGNEIHCLQSSEQQGAAQSEAYGHFIAGKLWNSSTDTQCVFTYYKAFLQPSGVKELPPSAKSCLQPVRWAETNCPYAGRAAEYDWMGFYTSLGRTAAPATVPQTDLKRVYSRMCTGSPTVKCALQTTSWAGLDSAASSEFGLGTARQQTFHNNGSAYGVTR